MSERRSPAKQWESLEDAELVDMYRTTGVDAAFAELVRRYQVRLFRVLLGMTSDGALAEELAQRALVKAATRIDQLKDGQAFYAWLLSIARGTALDERRAPRVRLRASEDSLAQRPTTADLGVQHSVRQVLAQLAPEEAMTLVLADLQGMSMHEIATALGVGESAAKMRVKRARQRFRDLYQGDA